MPIRATPETLGLKLLVSTESSQVFALCHPVDDGLPDRTASVVFAFDNGTAEPLRVFETEIVWMAVEKDALYCVDRLQKLYRWDETGWTDFENPSLVPYRINRLRTTDGKIYGVADDGMVFLWGDNQWIALTEEIEDLYLFDLMELRAGDTAVCGEEGYFAFLSEAGLRQVDLQTNASLISLLKISEDELLILGRKATALRYSQDQIEVVDASGRDLSFFNGVIWNNKILLSANSEISEVIGNEVATFAERRSGWLMARGEELWCQSDGSCAYTTDGTTWTPVEFNVEL